MGHATRGVRTELDRSHLQVIHVVIVRYAVPSEMKVSKRDLKEERVGYEFDLCGALGGWPTA